MRIRMLPFMASGAVVLGLWSVAPTGAQSPFEDLIRSQQTWHIDCMPKGCIASVDILRGESGETPDPNDSNQYVSVAVGVDSNDRKPSLVTLEVDAHADKQAGVDLLFFQDVSNGKSWKIVDDPGGPVHLSFARCNETECVAAIGGGTPDEVTMKSCSDLVARMQSANHLVLSYARDGRRYQTAINIMLFKEAYQRLLTQASAPQANSN